MLKSISFELYLTSNPFCDAKMMTYETYLPISWEKIGFNLMDDEDFTTSYIIDTIQNSSADHQLTKQDNKNLWIIVIYGGISNNRTKEQLMNPGTIRLHVVNPGSISVYAEGKSTRGQILKNFGLYLIK